MYAPLEVLERIDDHQVAIIALCGAAMAFNYTWFFIAFRVAARDGYYSLPLFCTFFWLAHDASMVWRFDYMFNTLDHWYVKLFWLALVFTVMFEFGYVYQAIKYGHSELLPEWSQAQFTALMLAGVVAAVIVWSYVKNFLGDDLYIVSFNMANVAYPLFAPALLIRRKSMAGQSAWIPTLYFGMLTCWFTATAVFYGSDFRSIEHVGIWAVCAVGLIGTAYAMHRMPKYEPERSDRLDAPQAPATAQPPEGAVA